MKGSAIKSDTKIARIEPTKAAEFISWYGPALASLNKFSEAEIPLREAHARLTAAGMGGSNRMRTVLSGLIKLCRETGRLEEAEKWRSELATLHAATHPITTRSAD